MFHPIPFLYCYYPLLSTGMQSYFKEVVITFTSFSLIWSHQSRRKLGFYIQERYNTGKRNSLLFVYVVNLLVKFNQ